jgi:hypothetical protein
MKLNCSKYSFGVNVFNTLVRSCAMCLFMSYVIVVFAVSPNDACRPRSCRLMRRRGQLMARGKTPILVTLYGSQEVICNPTIRSNQKDSQCITAS